MTNTEVPDPEYTKFDLPIDTISVTCVDVTLAVTGSREHPGQLIPSLIITSPEMGVYTFEFGRGVWLSLIDQCDKFSRLTAEQITRMLQRVAEDAQ